MQSESAAAVQLWPQTRHAHQCADQRAAALPTRRCAAGMYARGPAAAACDEVLGCCVAASHRGESRDEMLGCSCLAVSHRGKPRDT